MKKFTALLTALIMALGCTSAAFAADSSADVYVSIANKGELVVAYEQISVSDEDSDGKITINDTLITAHEEFYKDGASGYESKVVPPYDGLSLTKLWGNTNSGSFGYYVNNASAWSLSDEVKNGDSVYAFAYEDAKTYSDSYSFFNANTVTAEKGGTVELTLKRYYYDSSFNLVSAPVSGAVITVDGEKTSAVTDKNGKASVTLEKSGEHVISAECDSMIITPPVCIAEVEGGSVLDTVISVIRYIIEAVISFFKSIVSVF